MNRKEILETASNIVCHDRNDQYDSPEDNFGIIADLWNAYLQASNPSVYVDAHDVGIMMTLFKIGRIATGKPKEDSYVDAAGYIACAGDIALNGDNKDV